MKDIRDKTLRDCSCCGNCDHARYYTQTEDGIYFLCEIGYVSEQDSVLVHYNQICDLWE